LNQSHGPLPVEENIGEKQDMLGSGVAFPDDGRVGQPRRSPYYFLGHVWIKDEIRLWGFQRCRDFASRVLPAIEIRPYFPEIGEMFFRD
jgi:hypothetical protein